MHFFYHITLLKCVLSITYINCQQVLNERLLISELKAGEKVNIRRANVDRRFLEDLDDYEWHIAHLRGAILDGRRDCREDTFEDKVRRYRRMLKNDGARVDFVSSDPIPLNIADIGENSCKVNDDILNDTPNTESPSYPNVTSKINVLPTVSVPNVTSVENVTTAMKLEATTEKLDYQATTQKSKAKVLKKKKKVEEEQKAENDTVVRRASEYMFSSIEYYDESVEFNTDMCPDAVEVIELEIDQLRSYDLECEMTLEWRSLE
ncbi:hypothetical protein SFRURICE_004857 [Spodoptera frugiperda]|uniref:SFRICE_019493 n=1 Tax=Spodoptera frugiperda TaxID=7108 RepID=A0A2H1W612_SPOFR|nr:hypothetical protein SFRURICE_004857 [Spodoptera frugiperda]